MQKKMKFIDENMLLITVKILASSFVMGLFTYWVKDAVNSFDNIYIEFGVIILSGALVYVILLLLFGVGKALKRES
jgi:hypothetical protein